MYINVVDRNTWKETLYRNNKMMDPNAAMVIADWKALPKPPGFTWSGKMDMDHKNSNIVYLVGNNGSIWKCDYTDINNPVFIDITKGLVTIIPTRSIVLEKGSNEGLYIGRDDGLFYTNNSLGVWKKFSDLPNTHKNSLSINYGVNKIRVGLSARGVWEHDLYCPQDQIFYFPSTSTQSTNAFYEAFYEITSSASVLASNNNNISYRAGTYIELNPGFNATATGTGYFEALIHPCSWPGNSFKATSPSDKDMEKAFSREEENTLKKKTPDALVYPNPNNGIFTVFFNKESKVETNSTTNAVYVFDLLGRMVFKKENITNNKIELNISNQEKGIYFITTYNGENTFSTRIVIQ